jgi:hypothetical protein
MTSICRNALSIFVSAMSLSSVISVAGPSYSDTLQVEGRFLLDTCGRRLIIRGVEQPLGFGFESPAPEENPEWSPDWSFENLIDQIALTGANSVRILLDLTSGQPSFSEYEAAVKRAVDRGLVVYLTAGSYDWEQPHYEKYLEWFAQDQIKALVDRYKKWMIVDAVVEGYPETREEWRDGAIAVIQDFRKLGYTVPLTVMGPTAGRNLPAILEYGQEIEASDPLGRTILGWQAYWGSGGWYQGDFGGQEGLSNPTSIANGIAVAAQKSFPIQIGFDYRTDPGQTADYESGMTAAAEYDVGWLWWAYYHPFEPPVWRNGLSTDGTRSNLWEPYGPVVMSTHSRALSTAERACGL